MVVANTKHHGPQNSRYYGFTKMYNMAHQPRCTEPDTCSSAAAKRLHAGSRRRLVGNLFDCPIRRLGKPAPKRPLPKVYIIRYLKSESGTYRFRWWFLALWKPQQHASLSVSRHKALGKILLGRACEGRCLHDYGFLAKRNSNNNSP